MKQEIKFYFMTTLTQTFPLEILTWPRSAPAGTRFFPPWAAGPGAGVGRSTADRCRSLAWDRAAPVARGVATFPFHPNPVPNLPICCWPELLPRTTRRKNPRCNRFRSCTAGRRTVCSSDRTGCCSGHSSPCTRRCGSGCRRRTIPSTRGFFWGRKH